MRRQMGLRVVLSDSGCGQPVSSNDAAGRGRAPLTRGRGVRSRPGVVGGRDAYRTCANVGQLIHARSRWPVYMAKNVLQTIVYLWAFPTTLVGLAAAGL